MLKQTTRDLIAMFREHDGEIDRLSNGAERERFRRLQAESIRDGRRRQGALSHRRLVLALYLKRKQRPFSKLEILNTGDPIHRSYAFSNVVARVVLPKGEELGLCIPGVCYSEYESGPNLCLLADAVAELLPRAAYVGLLSCQRVPRGN